MQGRPASVSPIPQKQNYFYILFVGDIRSQYRWCSNLNLNLELTMDTTSSSEEMTSNSDPPQLSEPSQPWVVTRHPKYYYEDGSCIVQVITAHSEKRSSLLTIGKLKCGSVLYRIHRTIMADKSKFFAGMFAMPPGPDPTDGCSDERPFVIPREEQDFESLIIFLYDG